MLCFQSKNRGLGHAERAEWREAGLREASRVVDVDGNCSVDVDAVDVVDTVGNIDARRLPGCRPRGVVGGGGGMRLVAAVVDDVAAAAARRATATATSAASASATACCRLLSLLDVCLARLYVARSSTSPSS